MSKGFSLVLAAMFLLVLTLGISGSSWADPAQPFDLTRAPVAPDYASSGSWAVLPGEPRPYPVDVFYVHPTTYGGDENWNQSLEGESADPEVRDLMSSQAGVFRTSACLCAPYYRQANLAVLNSAEDSPNRKALNVAYSDVEAAFDAYMTHWNNGRPFILAGHSQGSEMILWLMERRFSDPKLRKMLVAAYIVGWSVTRDDLAKYPHLKVAATPDETGSIITYNTQGPDSEYSIVGEGAVAVNPLTMTITNKVSFAEENLGALFLTENGALEIPYYTGGQTVDGAFVIPTPSNIKDLDVGTPGFYHPYDYTFFYRNLQHNAEARVKAYLASH